MTSILRTAVAGTLESSDAYVTVEPAETVDITVESAVSAQFGPAIRKSVEELLQQYGITGVKLRLTDRGALDFVLRARVETALKRATEVRK